MVTLPESLRLLQVPHIPLAQEDGIGTPAAFAACRMLWPGAQSKLRPERAKVIRRVGADGAGAGGASSIASKS